MKIKKWGVTLINYESKVSKGGCLKSSVQLSVSFVYLRVTFYYTEIHGEITESHGGGMRLFRQPLGKGVSPFFLSHHLQFFRHSFISQFENHKIKPIGQI